MSEVKTKYLAICESDPGTQLLMNLFSLKMGFQPFIRKSCVELMAGLLKEAIIPEAIFLQPSNHFDEAFQELHQNELYRDYRDLPIIAITTDPRDEHREHMLALGLRETLLKPFGYDTLQRTVAMHCTGA